MCEDFFDDSQCHRSTVNLLISTWGHSFVERFEDGNLVNLDRNISLKSFKNSELIQLDLPSPAVIGMVYMVYVASQNQASLTRSLV